MHVYNEMGCDKIMKLVFLGATHEVTGSCFYLEAAGKKFLVDYGMEQGRDTFENEPVPVPASQLDFVLLTHAHIDHSGMLPLLYAKGFRGPVFATQATAKLCDIMLRDSAHIQEFEAEWRNRKGKRSGKEEYVPIYTMEDAMGIIRCFQGFHYQEDITPFPGIRFRFVDAGHLMGSSSIELFLTEEGQTRKLVFSGDIGNTDQPLIRDPSYIREADYVIMESTYGNRNHDKRTDYARELAGIIQSTFDRGGNVVIPSFAVGRTQEMLYFIRQIKEQKMVSGYGNFKVYVDSPLANEATEIYTEYPYECFDEEALELYQKGINPISFPGLRISLTSGDSKEINDIPEPKVIISASGMCDAGRIKHHLKHNLWREDSTILFVGYQANGTLGRSIVEGASEVKLFGEPVQVAARIMQLPGISGHADMNGLMAWAGAFTKKPKYCFVVHGEDTVTDSFAKKLSDELGFTAAAPYSGTAFDLLACEYILRTEGVPVQKAEKKDIRSQKAFDRLLALGQRLLGIIRASEGGANKDLNKFSRDLEVICDKYDRSNTE